MTLVGNDSGGAYSQIAAASARAGRPARPQLVRDAVRPVPATTVRRAPRARSDPVLLGQLLGRSRDRAMRASAAAYGLLIKHPSTTGSPTPTRCRPRRPGDPARYRQGDVDGNLGARPRCRARADRLVRATRSSSPGGPRTGSSRSPTPSATRPSWPTARVTLIDDAYSFTPEDQPLGLAAAIADV